MKQELTFGQTYHIVIEDCCVEGLIKGQFLGVKPYTDYLDDDYPPHLFDFGILTGHGWRIATPEEINDWVELFEEK